SAADARSRSSVRASRHLRSTRARHTNPIFLLSLPSRYRDRSRMRRTDPGCGRIRLLVFHWQQERNAKAIVRGVDIHAGTIAIQRLETRLHVGNADASATRRRSIRIARIVDDDLEQTVPATRVDAHLATLDQMRDTVMNGILDEGLKDQRRYAHLPDLACHIEACTQPLTETHALDREKGLNQGHLLGQCDRLLARQCQTLAKELRHQETHLTSGRCVLTDERGDGVQTVEQEMRVELRAE